MNDWTQEAAVAISLCEDWAQQVCREVNGKLFLFGSAIYKEGEQFDATHSDLDVVYIFPDGSGTLQRVAIMEALFRHKKELELRMVPALHRVTCDEPGVSVVPITEFEVQANIHKSAARNFFDRNFFYDLNTKTQSLGIPGAGTMAVREDRRQALEYVQKVRNQYLAVSANAEGGLDPFTGSDPMPKALLRSAAQLVPDAAEGEWYDTRLGLEFMFALLSERRTEDPRLKSLFDKVGVRRNARGRKSPLNASEQLLLAEMLFDKGSEVATERVITWELRVSGRAYSEEEVRALLAAVARLVPDARLIGASAGSIVLTLRSSIGSFELLQRLQSLGVLSQLLDADTAELKGPLEASPSVGAFENTRLSQLVHLISEWTPPPGQDWKGEEDMFFLYLQEKMGSVPELRGAEFYREVQFEPVEVAFRMDFLLSWKAAEGAPERIGIELAHLRSPSTFFHKIAQLLQLGRPVVLVLIAKRGLLERLSGDVVRLAQLNANIKIVSIEEPA